jgi:hypothetical protein
MTGPGTLLLLTRAACRVMFSTRDRCRASERAAKGAGTVDERVVEVDEEERHAGTLARGFRRLVSLAGDVPTH